MPRACTERLRSPSRGDRSKGPCAHWRVGSVGCPDSRHGSCTPCSRSVSSRSRSASPADGASSRSPPCLVLDLREQLRVILLQPLLEHQNRVACLLDLRGASLVVESLDLLQRVA